MSASNLPLDVLQKQLHTLYGKYKFMESQLVQQQRNLHTKIPEIKSALSALNYIQDKQSNNPDDTFNVQFELSDSLYATGNVKPQNVVMLWLGANVMLEYTYDEAEQLLKKNLSTSTTSLESLENDIDFLKDQITISEVNIARLHNYGIALKQQQQQSISNKTNTSPPTSSTTSNVGTINATGSSVSSSRSFAQAAAS